MAQGYAEGVEMTELTIHQITAVRCAYADLVGAYQCAIRDGNGGADNGHDWKAHLASIHELEDAFDFIEPAPTDDKEENCDEGETT